MIHFQSFSGSVDATEYVTKRLQALLQAFPEEQRAAVARGLADPRPDGALQLFVAAGDLDGAAEAMAAAGKAAEEHFPLIAGEQVETQELLALVVNRPDREAASLVLRQATNLATALIQVPDRIVSGGRIVPGDAIGQAPLAEQPPVEAVAAVPAWALALAKQLGQKLLEQLGSAVWDAVRKEVLGVTDLPSYYAQVYDELRRIVASAFQEHYVKEVKDLTAKFDQTMSFYNNMGRKEADFLIVKNTSFDLITKSNSLGFPGAFHYAEASVLHVMMLREGYLRLVEEKRPPDELQKAKAYVSAMARQLAANIVVKHGQLLAERMATISTTPFEHLWGATNSPLPGRTIGGVREGVFNEQERFLYACMPIQNMFRDTTNGFWNSMYFHLLKEAISPKHSWTWVNNNLGRYRTQIHAETLRDLHPLLDVAERLRKLAEA